MRGEPGVSRGELAAGRGAGDGDPAEPRSLLRAHRVASCAQGAEWDYPAVPSRRPSPRRLPRMCHVFAGHGPLKAGGTAEIARMKGIACDEWDVLQDAERQDLLERPNSERLSESCAEGSYAHLHAGIPCSTFTPILCMRDRLLRLRHQPWGRDGLSEERQRKVDEADRLIEAALAAAYVVADGGGEVTIENVADRGDHSLPCWWEQRKAMCPLSLHPRMVAAIAYLRLEQIHLPLCTLNPGGPQKWITLFATSRAAALLRCLGSLRCRHLAEEHGEAIGRDADGTSRAALTAAYPPQLSWWLTEVPLLGASIRAQGEIGWGAELHPTIREAVERARNEPPSFASFRKLEPMPAAHRWAAPIPTPHDTPAECSTDKPSASWTVEEGGADDERAASWPDGARRPPRPNAVPMPGAPPRPIAYEQIWRRVPEDGHRRTGYDMIVEWAAKAHEASRRLCQGDDYDDPGTLVVPNSLKEEWARPWLLDTRDAGDVLPVRRSSRHTQFDGVRQADRGEFRAAGERNGWCEVDPDIMAQQGEGGIESRSFAGRYSVFEFHHAGFRHHFELANEVNAKEYGESWLLGPFAMPPFEPMRSLPHNVVMQLKQKIDDESNLYTKLGARVTTDGSAFDADSINASVQRQDRTTVMPTAQSHASGAGITDAIVRRQSPFRAEQYVNDLSSAYRFLLMARTCWHEQCSYLVIVLVDPAGRRRVLMGWFVDPRLYFGGSYGPNRFERVARLKRAEVRRRQRAFDEAQPLPPGVLRVLAERSELQAAGLLPAGADQVTLGYLQVFIDDESGATANDPVSMPADVNVSDSAAPRFIDVAAILRDTASLGARPSRQSTRVVAHCCIAIDAALALGLQVAQGKSVCGDGIVVLGLRTDVCADRLDCPPAKAAVMTAELGVMREQATNGSPVDRAMVERNVGRLCNISQVDPSVLFLIHVGYALINAATRPTAQSPRRRQRWLHLKRGGSTAIKLVAMVDNSVASLAEARGVPLVTAPAFPSRTAAGTLVTITDASGEDGAGGFAFMAGKPKEVWVVHAPWPADVRAALARSAMPHALRQQSAPAPVMSMPAGELFVPWAVTEAVRDAGQTVLRTVAVMDCKPAVFALSAGKSKAPLLRSILGAARASIEQWLGVHVTRDYNTDADLLSHPATVHEVVARAVDAGLEVHEVGCTSDAADDTGGFPQRCWQTLRAGIAEQRQQ